MAYDHGPGRVEEHRHPHRVAGTVAGRSWRERARALDTHARLARPDVARPIHRTALRLAPGDRALTDREWRQVAQRYIREMGFEHCPWEATRHAGDHIHITVSRVQWDGQLAREAHDYARAQKACRGIEAEHGLADASARFNRGAPQVSHGERLSAQRRGVRPERDQLRDRLRAAENASRGTRAGYDQALAAQGVLFAANVASTGRVSGYRYTLAGHRNATGEQVWFTGSQLGKDFSWTNTHRRIQQVQSPDHAIGQARPADTQTPKAGAGIDPELYDSIARLRRGVAPAWTAGTRAPEAAGHDYDELTQAPDLDQGMDLDQGIEL